MSVSLCMVIHSHQPVGNFDHVIEEAFQKSYQPFLSVLARHPHIRLSLHYSGILLEWLDERHPEFMAQLQEMTDRGQVEHVGGGYYEPILAAIPDAEKVAQIRKQATFLRERFGRAPQGAWLTERVWDQGLILPLVEAGVRYTILDDTHFLAAGVDAAQLNRAYLTEETGLPLKLAPSLQSLRYTIPFREPEETIDLLRAGMNSPGALFAVGDDCEKFGVWPGTYDHCYGRGWLERFFQALEGAGEWLRVTTLSEYLARCQPQDRIYIPTASYEEMMTWALPAAASIEFHECLEETTRLPHGDRFRRFLRGGQWRSFLSKYPEANQIQKLMLRTCQRWHRLRGVIVPGTAKDHLLLDAQDELLRSQCNDAYWHGIFGGLYAPHLRSAVLRHLIRAERTLDQADPNGTDSAVRADVEDFDVDGREEILLDHKIFALVARPGDGGTLSSLRFKPAGVDLINSLARRPEAYHKLIHQHAGQNAASPGAPASIHDQVHSKDSNLAASLHYDRYARHAFRAYLFSREKRLEDFANLQLSESTELAQSSWEVATPPDSSGAFGLRFEGTARIGNAEVDLRVKKSFKTASDDRTWKIECLLALSSRGPEPVPCSLGIEMVLNLLAPDSPERYFAAQGERHPLGFQGEMMPGSQLTLVDECERLEIRLDGPHISRWWLAPIQTVSQSESGFERVYQGSAILAVWDGELSSEKEMLCGLRAEVRFTGL